MTILFCVILYLACAMIFGRVVLYSEPKLYYTEQHNIITVCCLVWPFILLLLLMYSINRMLHKVHPFLFKLLTGKNSNET